MFLNYLVTAIRNFARHKLYSFINVVGLAVGLACAIFIILFIRDELSYDRWIPDSADLYRAEAWFYFPGHGTDRTANVPFQVTPSMLAGIPEVRAQTHLIPESMTAKVGDRQFSEFVDVVDPDFFQLIRLPLAQGNPATVFAQPESIVLSQAIAKKYFGSADPIGRTVVMDGEHPLTVTGVMRDLPSNTQLVADIALPNTSKADKLPLSEKDKWFNIDGEGFVRLAPGVDPNVVLAKLKPILDKNIDTRKELNIQIPGSQALQMHLTRFRDDHLTSDNYGGLATAGNWATIYGFAAIAALILLIACFNFMNLATARAMLRAREVSLRKTMGASRRQLVAQFLGESVFIALIASILALAIVEILLPAYNGFLGRTIRLNYLQDWDVTLGILGLAVGAGLLGGIYPALVLSGFRPAAILKTNAAKQSGSGLLRTTLVVAQFSISIGLGIAAIVVFAQIRHARQVDLGFDRNNLVVISGADDLSPSLRDSLSHALAAEPSIAGVAQSWSTPFGHSIDNETIQLPGEPQTYDIRTIDVDPDFPRVYGMKFLAGRSLSLSRGEDINSATGDAVVNDGRNVLINAAAVGRFGYTMQDAVGKTFAVGTAHVTVVGVLGDAKVDGVRTPSIPIIYYYNPSRIDSLSVRVKSGQIETALTAIDKTWRQFAPTHPIRRRFLSEMFDRLFKADEKQGAMFGIFVGIAIFIACLGLFGLAAFTAERRTKEIGVRKVFGARTRDIVRLLLWQFSVPVLIANLIAWPVAWYYLSHWLEGYAYRITLNPIYFLAASAIALLIAWATVMTHAIRVARANPINALRYE